MVEMRNFEGNYTNYQDILTTINYLELMSETFIFETYKKILLNDSEKAFPEDISLENRDMFYRLKFRALNSSRS
jgi:hypothetical protein